MFTIHYVIRFVSGNLVGLYADCKIKYPDSSRTRVEADFTRDIESRRVLTGVGNVQYVIEDYWLEFDGNV